MCSCFYSLFSALFSVRRPVPVESEGAGREDAESLYFSSNLPIVVIDTFGQTIPDEPKIVARMGIINNDSARNLTTNAFNEYDGRISIEIRGISSQQFPKKSYALETQDEQGRNYNVPLLGMPKENDWILYAPYSDKSLMRNVLAFRLANERS